MAQKIKYYVVWRGRKSGIFNSWTECKEQIEGYQDAKYKSFKTLDEAQKAFQSDSKNYLNYCNTKKKQASDNRYTSQKPVYESISVDAACSGNPGVMEYRGVNTASGDEIFHRKYTEGTNNIGEFLAIVHALALLKKRKSRLPVYTDSAVAQKWVRDKKCGSKMKSTPRNKQLFEMVARAEDWLQNNDYDTTILKWNTKAWGEIPADFGRK